jgi:hypothetical protein
MGRFGYAAAMEQNDERWLPVVGWEGVYEVSDRGRVKRVGPAKGVTIGQIRSSKPNIKGYPAVQLWRDNQREPWLTHRLVAEAFIGPCPEGHEINHKDGNPQNLRPSNLEWVTHRENQRHAADVLGRKMGRPHQGEANGGGRKLTEVDVREIRQLHATGSYTLAELGEQFEVTKQMIWQIVHGYAWTIGIQLPLKLP